VTLRAANVCVEILFHLRTLFESIVVNQKGTYALVLRAGRKKRVQVGRLGKLLVQPGFYIYIGSAFGPGGLKARLNHHLKPAAKPHWHIDYLRRNAQIIEIWYTTDPLRRERDWVLSMEKLPATAMIFPGFGASDSHDVSHLFLSRDKPGFESFANIIKGISGHGDVFLSESRAYSK
jgi:Uri superfamily endonuclease